MVAHHTGRYSKYLRPINIIFDVMVVTVLAIYFFADLNLSFGIYLTYQTITWLLIAVLVKYYEVFRFTTPVEIITKILKQFSVFLLIVIDYFPFDKTSIFSGKKIALFMIFSFFIIVCFKYCLFFYLKKYRMLTGNNFRNTVIIGHSREAVQLKEVFETRKDYGYHFFGFFSNTKQHPDIIGTLDDLMPFVLENKIDEIYCSLKEISNEKLKELVDFAEDNHKHIKFIPDTKDIYSKNLKVDYYELFPVLSLQRTELHNPFIAVIKRVFDIIFSLVIIVFILSWLIPILAIIIKLESKGPVFFNQKRVGLGEHEFTCYKFRSMRLNKEENKLATKDDPRITKVGKFMRRTSIDELPQFFNVLLGNMSVVGPRPHIPSQNKIYSDKIKKFRVRHFVKPGVTGLAQVKGYRGEIESESDMINRIRCDLFYIENWSLLLDVKIIIQTIVNFIKGDEKAY